MTDTQLEERNYIDYYYSKELMSDCCEFPVIHAVFYEDDCYDENDIYCSNCNHACDLVAHQAREYSVPENGGKMV